MSVKEYLPACFAGMPIFTYDMVDSTNNAAKRYFLDGGILPALFIADGQTAGRGRNGRSFFSPSGAGLYMSLALPINTSPDKAISFTAIAAVAVCKAIEQLTDIRPAIKWVNDIYVSERKVCGILVEAMPDKDGNMAAVIGIGINVLGVDFPEELRDIAGSVESQCGVSLSRAELCTAVYDELLEIYRDWQKDSACCLFCLSVFCLFYRASVFHRGKRAYGRICFLYSEGDMPCRSVKARRKVRSSS